MPKTAAPPQAMDLPGWHPLEIFPFFQRLPSSAWRDFAYTFVFNSLVALAFSLVAVVYRRDIGFAAIYYYTWVYSNVIGYLIHGALALNRRIAGARIAAWSPPVRGAWYAGITTPTVVLGYAAATWLLGQRDDLALGDGRELAATLALALVISMMLAAISIVQVHRAQTEASNRRAQLGRAEAERLAADARLRLLQAQVEPHFLFNTLANVASLIDSDAPRAKRMLEDFTDFLRAALTSIREPTTTLRRERDLLGAYLRVLKVRMGPRLEYAFAIDDELLDRPFPAMVLQPLVENAVKHGIDPAVRGGRITVGAQRREGMLVVYVADDGVGSVPDARTGVGLGSVEERLRAEYGPGVRLSLDAAAGGGTQVTLVLPAG